MGARGRVSAEGDAVGARGRSAGGEEGGARGRQGAERLLPGGPGRDSYILAHSDRQDTLPITTANRVSFTELQGRCIVSFAKER